ncbi:MAG: alpha/beta hydrolase [Candidatus Cybelea sp.]
MRTIALMLSALTLIVAMAAARDSSETALGPHIKPCRQGHTKIAALCGTFGVYEDRKTRAGHVIELGITVLKAKHPNVDAIAYIEGGPGIPALPNAPFIADGDDPVLKAFAGTYDIIFVDNRGMGVSNPTRCNIAPYGNMAAYFLQIWPGGILSSCYKRYAKTSNPSAYNTNNAADDLDDVRTALGYRKLLLYGGSYGSFFSFIYIRRHEDRVKSAVLFGIQPPHFESLPGAPDGAQVALDDLVAKCAHDENCRSHFPQFSANFQAVLGRFRYGPVPMQVLNPKTKRMESVRLSKEVLVDRIRENLYSPDSAAFLPYIIERAYHRDYVPLGLMIDVWSQFLAHGQDAGTNLAYRCADLDPFISEAELKAQAARSFTGNLRVRAERRACAIWKVDPMPAAFNEPVRSGVPILMFEGSDDPVTPPKYAARAMATLPNAKLVLVRGAGHGVVTLCTNRLAIQFIRENSGTHIVAASCSAAFKAPQFETSMARWNY